MWPVFLCSFFKQIALRVISKPPKEICLYFAHAEQRINVYICIAILGSLRCLFLRSIDL